MPINTLPVRDSIRSYLDYYRNNKPEEATYDFSSYGLPSQEALQAIVESVQSAPQPIDPIMPFSVGAPNQSTIPISALMGQPVMDQSVQQPMGVPMMPVAPIMPIQNPNASLPLVAPPSNTPLVQGTQVGAPQGIVNPLDVANDDILRSIEAYKAMQYPNFSPQSYNSPYEDQIATLRQSMPQVNQRANNLLLGLSLLNGIGGILAPSAASVFASQAQPYGQGIAANNANFQQRQKAQLESINDLIAKDAQERQDFILNEQKRQDSYSNDKARFDLDKQNRIVTAEDKRIDNATQAAKLDMLEQKYKSGVDMAEAIIKANPNLSEVDKQALRGLGANGKFKEITAFLTYGGSATKYAEFIGKLDKAKLDIDQGKISLQEWQRKNYKSIIEFRKLMGEQGWNRLNISYGNLVARVSELNKPDEGEIAKRTEKIASAQSSYNDALGNRDRYLQELQSKGIIKITDAKNGVWVWDKYDAEADARIGSLNSTLTQAKEGIEAANSIPMPQTGNLDASQFAPNSYPLTRGLTGSENPRQDPTIKNAESSASGIGQMIDSTWKKRASLYDQKYGTNASRYSTMRSAPEDMQWKITEHYLQELLDAHNGDWQKAYLEYYSGSRSYANNKSLWNRKPNAVDGNPKNDGVRNMTGWTYLKHIEPRLKDQGLLGGSESTPQSSARQPSNETKEVAARDFNGKLRSVRSSMNKDHAQALLDKLDKIGSVMFSPQTVDQYRRELNTIINK